MSGAAARQVLIVDDDLGVCEFLTSFFSLAEIRAVEAATLRAATACLERETFQIVFIDKHLPDGNGIDFAALAKRSFPTTLFVVLTGDATARTMEAVKEAAIVRCLAKPLSSLDALDEICAGVFENWKSVAHPGAG